MKTRLTLFHLMPLALLCAGPLPAAAQGTAERVPVDGCELNFSVITNLPADVVEAFALGSSFNADQAEIQCSGSSPGQVLILRCSEQLNGWSGGAFRASGFPCDLTDEFCPGVVVPEEADADISRLTISRTGRVDLFCQRNVVR